MIRRSRSLAPYPEVLDKPYADGKTERARSVEHYAAWDGKKSYDWKRYKEQAVKDAMDQIFLGKCAYCECRYDATQPVDVEHYRPKGEVQLDDGGTQKPGYYWLGADWDNLLPSCIDCNRERYHDFPEGDSPRLSGKANWFPISNPSRRATAPDTEGDEARELLHPCRDYPHKALDFGDHGTVRPRLRGSGSPSPKGVASIRVYGLDRVELIREREEVWTEMKSLVDELLGVSTALDILVSTGAPPGAVTALEETLASQIKRLKAYAKPNRRFSAMAQAVLDELEGQLPAP